MGWPLCASTNHKQALEARHSMHTTTDQSRIHVGIPIGQREPIHTANHDQQSPTRAPTRAPLSSEAQQHIAQAQWQAYTIELGQVPPPRPLSLAAQQIMGKCQTAHACSRRGSRAHESITKLAASPNKIPTYASTSAVIFRREHNA